MGTDYTEIRVTDDGEEVYIPVPRRAATVASHLTANKLPQVITVAAVSGSSTVTDYLRQLGARNAAAQPLNLTQFLQQAAQQNAAAQAMISVRGPQGASAADGSSYVPAGTPLPYTLSLNNTTGHAVGQVRIVTELDANLDARSLRLGDLKLGDINVHIPVDKAVFQGDFDFTGIKG